MEPEATGPWRCKDDVVWVREDLDRPAVVKINVVTLLGQVPFEGLEVFACPPFDLTCQNPISTGTSDAQGILSMDVYVGFRGHFFAPPTADMPDIAPTLVFVFPPPTGEEMGVVDGNVNVTSIAEIRSIGMLENVEVVDGLGHLFFTALDCDGQRAPGISTSAGTVDPKSINIYITDSGLPSKTISATTNRGEGAILNLPPGFVTISGVSEDVGKVFEETVLIAADTITGVPIVASP